MKQFDIQKESKNSDGENIKEESGQEINHSEETPLKPKAITPAKIEEKEKIGIWPYFLGVLIGIGVVVGVLAFISYRNKSHIETETATPVEETNENTNFHFNENANSNENLNLNENVNSNLNENLNTNSTAGILEKSKYAIQVQNGNGITGDAAKVKSLLEKNGWTVKSVTNANNFNYVNTMVYYKAVSEEAAKEVANILKENGRQTAMHESTTIKYDIVIITGKK